MTSRLTREAAQGCGSVQAAALHYWGWLEVSRQCRDWSSIHVSSRLFHAKQRLPHALSARNALHDLPVPLEPAREGKDGVVTMPPCHPYPHPSQVRDSGMYQLHFLVNPSPAKQSLPRASSTREALDACLSKSCMRSSGRTLLQLCLPEKSACKAVRIISFVHSLHAIQSKNRVRCSKILWHTSNLSCPVPFCTVSLKAIEHLGLHSVYGLYVPPSRTLSVSKQHTLGQPVA